MSRGLVAMASFAETAETTTAPSNLQVVVRLRPAPGTHAFAATADGTGVASAEDPSAPPIIKCARAYGPDATNQRLFADFVKKTLDDFLQGKTCSLLAYGQTGSGKTHTMFGWPGAEEGLVTQAVQYVFDSCLRAKRQTRYRIAVSFIECYQERIRDLLSDGGTAPNADLPLRESQSGACFVPDATLRICHDASTALELLTVGSSNKAIGNSYIHNQSSRSHTIFTLSVASERNVAGEAPSVKMSRYMFVDLAGSEMLTAGFGAEQQAETKAINLSLLSLRGVMDALASGAAHIPYRNSVLTRLLSQALSPSGSTVAICNCSPLPENAALTTGTLRFADVAGRIEQHAKIHEFIRQRDGVVNVGAAKEVAVKMQKLTTASSSLAAPAVVPRRSSHDVDVPGVGTVVVHVAESSLPAAKSNRLAIFLHAFGGGCGGRDFAFFDDALVSAGYTVVGPDFPGFGKSPGKRQASRTERLRDSDGPIGTVEAVINWACSNYAASGSIKGTRLLLMGYDWGGNMALTLAIDPRWKKHIDGLVLHHPSWTDKPALLSAAATVPTLMLWVPNDQLHLISMGRKLAAAIGKSAQLVSMVPPEAGREITDAEWADALLRNALPWMQSKGLLSTSTPKAPPEAIPTAPKPAAAVAAAVEVDTAEDGDEFREDGDDDSDDDDGSFSTQSSFLACLLADPIAAEDAIASREKELVAARKAIAGAARAAALAARQQAALAGVGDAAPGSGPVGAVRNLRLILAQAHPLFPTRAQYIDALLSRGAGRALHPELLAAIGKLPTIPPYAAGDDLVRAALWPAAPKGTCGFCPRYCTGRRVFVELSNIDTDFTSPNFGRVRAGQRTSHASRGDGFLTFRAFIGTAAPNDAATPNHVPVLVEEAGSDRLQSVLAPVAALDRWNAPTAFPTAGSSPLTITLDDAIRASYASLHLKAKICECAVAIAPFVGEMDFSAAVAERLAPSPPSDMPANRALLQLQTAAVVELRKRMNTIHHVAMGKDPARMCVPDVGRLATFGQWHCHGMASVFAAMLLPFAGALGIAVKFRDGFFYSSGRDDTSNGWDGTPRRIADHTWLEVTFFPSGATYCCDPSFTDRDEPILVSLEEAYSTRGRRYPFRELTCRTASQELAPEAVPLHVPEAAAHAMTTFYHVSKVLYA